MVPKWTILSVFKCKIPKFSGLRPETPWGGGLQRPQTPPSPPPLLHSLRECGSLRSYARQTFRPTDKLPFSSLYAFQMESICRQKKLRLQAANIFVDHCSRYVTQMSCNMRLRFIVHVQPFGTLHITSTFR